MRFCEPSGSTYDEAIGVVRFVEAKPEIRLGAAAIVHEALSAAWPCPR